DLAPYQPSGWDAPIVVATQPGGTTSASNITVADTVYVDWAVVNQGNASVTTAFATSLMLDGNVVHSWTTNPPLDPSFYASITDYSLGQLGAGTHTLRLVVDPANQVTE